MSRLFGVIAFAAMALSTSAMAQNLVVNGGFDQVTTHNGGVAQTGPDNYVVTRSNDPAGYVYGYDVTGWSTSSSIAVVFGSGISDNDLYGATHGPEYGWSGSGANTRENWNLAGPNYTPQPINSGLTASSPQGGNFFGEDSNFLVGAMTQTISGLMVGQNYTLSFWWAGSQLANQGNPNGTDMSSGWNVSLGSDVSKSVSATYKFGGFSGWQQEIYNFTASASSEVLSFTPFGSGTPPMSLLDGVAIYEGINVVPEPAEWALAVAGFGLIALRLRSRRQQSQ